MPKPRPRSQQRQTMLQSYTRELTRHAEQATAAIALQCDKAAATWAAASARDAQALAETANRAKSEFFAQMGHELRTPLNAIIGFAQIMKSEMLGRLENDAYRDYAVDIHHCADQLLDVVNELLEVSWIESGQATLSEEAVDLGAMVRTCLRLVEPRVSRGDLTVDYRCPPDLPLVWGDERRLTQIVINLLSNAAKGTPSGGEITVTLSRHAQGGLILFVCDTGIGMTPEDEEWIMRPTCAEDTMVARDRERGGMGLKLAKVFAEMHGGQFFLENQPGAGTAVGLFLPPSRIRPRS